VDRGGDLDEAGGVWLQNVLCNPVSHLAQVGDTSVVLSLAHTFLAYTSRARAPAPHLHASGLQWAEFVFAFFCAFLFLRGEAGLQESTGQVLAAYAEGDGQSEHDRSHHDGERQEHGGVGQA